MLRQRMKLWRLWASFSLLIFIPLVIFTFTKRFGFEANLDIIWFDFFGKLIVSNLLVIVSTFILEERVGLVDRPPASKFLFKLCFGFSLIYLIIVFLAIPIHDADRMNPNIDSFNSVLKICGSIWPIISVTLAIFFYGDNLREYIANRRGPRN